MIRYCETDERALEGLARRAETEAGRAQIADEIIAAMQEQIESGVEPAAEKPPPMRFYGYDDVVYRSDRGLPAGQAEAHFHDGTWRLVPISWQVHLPGLGRWHC